MQRKVLIAVDGSVESLMACRYIGQTMAGDPEFEADLVHIIPALPPILVQESRTSGQALIRMKQAMAKGRNRAEAVLGRAEEELTRAGMAERRIGRVVTESKGDVAQTLVREAENGLYDALVSGRRGLGRVQEMFLGSVSQKVIQKSRAVPIWLVDGETLGHRILVALDGSEGSFKAVDHVGFMLAHYPDKEIILFHSDTELAKYCRLDVDDDLADFESELLKKAEDQCLKTFFARAVKILTEAGVDPGRIEIVFRAKRLDASRAILAEAKERGCGAIVIGKSAAGRAKELFIGSVTSRVVQGGSDRAVWVVT